MVTHRNFLFCFLSNELFVSGGSSWPLPVFPPSSFKCASHRVLRPTRAIGNSDFLAGRQRPWLKFSFWLFSLISSGHSESQVLFQVFKGRGVHSPRSLPKFILYLKDFRLQTSMDISTVDWNSKSRFNKDKVKGRLGKWDLQWGEDDFHQVCKPQSSCLDRGENSVRRNSQVWRGGLKARCRLGNILPPVRL